MSNKENIIIEIITIDNETYHGLTYINFLILSGVRDEDILECINNGGVIDDVSMHAIIKLNKYQLFKRILKIININKLLSGEWFDDLNVFDLCCFYDNREHFIKKLLKNGYKLDLEYYKITKNKKFLLNALYRNENQEEILEILKMYGINLSLIFSGVNFNKKITKEDYLRIMSNVEMCE